ncbi:hypothetical protein GBF38_008975, partial [Nibea albiflora]
EPATARSDLKADEKAATARYQCLPGEGFKIRSGSGGKEESTGELVKAGLQRSSSTPSK